MRAALGRRFYRMADGSRGQPRCRVVFDLVYNVDFEIIAFLFAILLYVETCVCYPRQTRKNRIFRVMTVLVIVSEAFDLVSAFTITYGASIPRIVNILINSGYFASGLFLCFLLHYYIQNAVVPPEGKPVLIGVNKIILAAMETSVLLNAFFGYFFSISPEGAYVHGPLYLVLHLASLWFVACGSATLIVNRKLLNRPQRISSVLFIALYLVAVILQTFVAPDVLIIMPAVSAMLIIAIFSLESPDYVQLQKILLELTQTKQELEAANEKYYTLAYTDLMTGLQNRTAYNLRLEQLGADPTKSAVTFLIADINNLKYLNDSFGHQVGDDAIEKTANLLKDNFTDGCQCYRIGGDEFAVIAQGLSEDAFQSSYRRFIADAEAESKRAAYPFSIAAGYRPVGSLTLLDALKQADERMYRNKIAAKQAAEGQG